MTDSAPSSFSLWLEEALSGWIVPVAALLLVALVATLYMTDVVSEEATASLVVLAAGVGLALYVARPALDRRRDGATRALAAAAAVATLLAASLPALRTVHPGDPLFVGQVSETGEAVPVPSGLSGPVRLLVSGKLPDRGEPSVTFTIRGTEPPVEGRLERTFGYARVGRGGRARVAHDHTADYYPTRIAQGTRALELDDLRGQLGSPLRIAAYREPIPLAGGPWALAGLALLLACLADARLGLRNDLAVAAGMGAAFGLLVTLNATPAAAVGPAVGGLILGALTGAILGWMAGALVRRFVPPAPRAQGGSKGARAA